MSVKETEYSEQSFLDIMKSKNQRVQIYLMGGIKLIGEIKSFDDYTVAITTKEYGVQIVYKHSITTISPFHGEFNGKKKEEKMGGFLRSQKR